MTSILHPHHHNKTSNLSQTPVLFPSSMRLAHIFVFWWLQRRSPTGYQSCLGNHSLHPTFHPVVRVSTTTRMCFFFFVSMKIISVESFPSMISLRGWGKIHATHQFLARPTASVLPATRLPTTKAKTAACRGPGHWLNRSATLRSNQPMAGVLNWKSSIARGSQGGPSDPMSFQIRIPARSRGLIPFAYNPGWNRRKNKKTKRSTDL